MKHTPGPWKFGQEDDERTVYNVLNETLTMKVLISGDNSRANAELIARAPELLEENESLKASNDELIKSLEDLVSALPSGNYTSLYVEKAKSILAKSKL